jgi:hypothetical protein
MAAVCSSRSVGGGEGRKEGRGVRRGRREKMRVVFAVMSCAGVQIPADVRAGDCSTLLLVVDHVVELC